MKKNILLKTSNITQYFTERNKIILFGLLNILFANSFINSTSALKYQSSTDIEFSVNPSISVSVSGNLTIDSLALGSSSDSNNITVTVSTNNVNGYHLDATVGDNNHSNPSFNTTNLTHSNNTNIFTSLSPSDSLSTLTTDNTWGYSYSNDSGTTWSNYSGLPIYTSLTPALLDSQYTPGTYTTNFKIAAKASNSQIAGEYSNVINFTATTFPSPLSLEEAYAYYEKNKVTVTDPNTGITGSYYKMQDMTTGICSIADIESKAQLVDIRDDTVYWVGRAKDGNCWMTQNLKLGKQTDTLTLTQATSNVGPDEFTLKGANGSFYDETIEDIPFQNNNSQYYCSNNYGCYYNWFTATAGFGTTWTPNNSIVDYNICPANWTLPTGGSNGQFAILYSQYNSIELMLVDNPQITTENTTGKIPGFLYSGTRSYNSNDGRGSYGLYWSRSAFNSSRQNAYDLFIQHSDIVNVIDSSRKSYGEAVRCLAK